MNPNQRGSDIQTNEMLSFGLPCDKTPYNMFFFHVSIFLHGHHLSLSSSKSLKLNLRFVDRGAAPKWEVAPYVRIYIREAFKKNSTHAKDTRS